MGQGKDGVVSAEVVDMVAANSHSKQVDYCYNVLHICMFSIQKKQEVSPQDWHLLGRDDTLACVEGPPINPYWR